LFDFEFKLKNIIKFKQSQLFTLFIEFMDQLYKTIALTIRYKKTKVVQKKAIYMLYIVLIKLF